jgi:crotonobetainyl-CoA:carnitine CoA-transferase CaiB-like acyl-CoA transferase
MRFYKTKPKKTTFPPGLGQHSMEILAELGYSAKRVEQFKANHVLG